ADHGTAAVRRLPVVPRRDPGRLQHVPRLPRRRPGLAGAGDGLAALRRPLRLGGPGHPRPPAHARDPHHPPDPPLHLPPHHPPPNPEDNANPEADAVLPDSAHQMWTRLTKDNDQIFLPLNGHYWPPARTTMKNTAGNDAHVHITNYQNRYYGGAAMIRLYHF